MVAQRRDMAFHPRKSAYTTIPGKKPTKAQQRAARDLANKQAAWDSTYGKKPVVYKDGIIESVYDDKGNRKPTIPPKVLNDDGSKRSPFARTGNIYGNGAFDAPTDYERRAGYAFAHPRVNYLAMDEDRLETIRKTTGETDKRIMIDAAFRVLRMQLVIDTAIRLNVNAAQLALCSTN
jgi:hypothetical protein